MMRVKFFRAIGLMLFGIAACFADVFDKALTESSKESFRENLKVLTASPLTTGQFKQTKTIKKLNREFVSTGTFAIHQKSGILWDTHKPFASILWVGNDVIVQMDQGRNHQKSISAKENPVFAEFSKTIQSVFSGNGEELERNFNVFFEKKGDHFSIGLVPKEKNISKVFASIILEGQRELEKVILMDGDSNPVVYEFSNHKHFEGFESVDDKSVKELYEKFQKAP